MKSGPTSTSLTRAGVPGTRMWRTGSARGVASVNERRLACDHHRVTMQVFPRDHFPMIAAPVQCDLDGIRKGSHGVSVSPIKGRLA
jgi:hypothetical protein